MQDTLREIREYLRQKAYLNEEHVRLALVCCVLRELGWDIWNPREVCAEFVPNRSEDNTKVDLALFVNRGTPSVFIETKAVGKMDGNLSTIEGQVRDYNRNNTAPFSIITDGRKWRFYYSQTGGEFHQKCFKHFDVLNDELENIEVILRAFLTKESLSGDAENDAKKYLQLSMLAKAIQDCLPEARRAIDHNPRMTLLEAIVELLKGQWPHLTVEEVEKHWHNVDVNPPTRYDSGKPSVTDPVITGEPDYDNISDSNFRYTKARGNIFGKRGNSWRELVEISLAFALDNGLNISDLGREVNVNLQEGRGTESGFHPIDRHNASFQGMNSNRSYHCLRRLATVLRQNIELEITFGRKHPRRAEGTIKIRLP